MKQRYFLKSVTANALVPGDVIMFGSMGHRKAGVVIAAADATQQSYASKRFKVLLLSLGQDANLQNAQFYTYEYVSVACEN